MAELVGLNVEVIVTHAPAGVRAAKAATSTIPVVIARMDNADVAGFAASLARRAETSLLFPFRLAGSAANCSSC